MTTKVTSKEAQIALLKAYWTLGGINVHNDRVDKVALAILGIDESEEEPYKAGATVYSSYAICRIDFARTELKLKGLLSEPKAERRSLTLRGLKAVLGK